MRKRRRKLRNGLGYTLGRILFLLFILLFVIGVIWFVVTLILNASRAVPKNRNALPFSNNDVYAFSDDSLIYIKDGILYYDDINGRANDASYKINTSNVEITASSTICAIYNQNSVKLLRNSSSAIEGKDSIEGHGDIEKVKCGLDYVAVLFKDEIGEIFLKIFDKNAVEIDEIRPESENSFIMDFGFTDTDNNTLWTVLADTSSETTVSTITTYDLSKKSTTGVMSVQNQLVESLNFTDNSIFAVGTNDLMRYNNGVLTHRLPIYGYKLLDFSSVGGKCVFLFESRTPGSSRSALKLYNVSEKEASVYSSITVNLPYDTITALLVNGKVVAVCPNKIYTYSYSGTLLTETELDFTVTEPGAVKMNDHEILLHSSSSISRYKVK